MSRILIAGGGTAGHVVPALAVADVLSERGYEVHFCGGPRGMEGALVPRAGYPFSVVRIRGFTRHVGMTTLRTLASLPVAAVDAWKLLRRLRPVPPPAPTGPPIERLAANLRRLDGELRQYAVAGPLPGKRTRMTAAQQAYEDLLVQACHALEVDQHLSGLRGPQRTREVHRIEAALAAAGLSIAAAAR